MPDQRTIEAATNEDGGSEGYDAQKHQKLLNVCWKKGTVVAKT